MSIWTKHCLQWINFSLGASAKTGPRPSPNGCTANNGPVPHGRGPERDVASSRLSAVLWTHRSHIRHWASICFWVLTVVSVTGCSMHRYEHADPLDNRDLQATCLSALRDRYPDSCRLTQRIVVHAGHKDFDMTGYLFMKPDGSLLALGLGDMGIELFRFQCDSEQCEVITKPGSFPVNPLYDGVIGDIQHLFARGRQPRSYLVRRGDATPSLVLRYDDGRLDEYQSVDDCDFPARSLGAIGGKVVREVTYHSPMSYPGCPHLLPSKIVLRNHRWHYTMEITLLEVRTLQ